MWMNAAQKRSRKGERLIGFQKILFYLLSVKFHIFSSIFIWINLKKAPKFQFAVRTTILVFILTFIKILFSSNANSCMENENKFFAGEKQMNEFRANRNSFRFFNMLINFLMKWEYTLGFTRWQFVNIYRWTEFCKFSDTKSYNIYDMFFCGTAWHPIKLCNHMFAVTNGWNVHYFSSFSCWIRLNVCADSLERLAATSGHERSATAQVTNECNLWINGEWHMHARFGTQTQSLNVGTRMKILRDTHNS